MVWPGLQWVISNILIVLAVRTSVFKYSNKWLVMLWLEAVSLAIMAFCFLISTFFSRYAVKPSIHVDFVVLS